VGGGGGGGGTGGEGGGWGGGGGGGGGGVCCKETQKFETASQKKVFTVGPQPKVSHGLEQQSQKKKAILRPTSG